MGNRGEQRHENLSVELWLQMLPGLEAKTNKRLRKIIVKAGEFTG